jgi:hypothetical protein
MQFLLVTLGSPILKGQHCLTLEDGTDRFSPNVGNYQSTLRNIPEDLRPHLHRGESLKSHTERNGSDTERDGSCIC